MPASSSVEAGVIDAAHRVEIVAERAVGGRRDDHDRVADGRVQPPGGLVADHDLVRAGAGRAAAR